MQSITHLVVGLGNPGAAHKQDRHNIGFMAIDHIGDSYSQTQFQKGFSGLFAPIQKHSLVLLKPQTGMNLSGEPVQKACNHYQLNPKQVIVIHDEIDLNLEEIRVKSTGGMAGHKGLLSIKQHIGQDFCRIRVGIGRPDPETSVEKHVLGKFQDPRFVEPALKRISQILTTLLDSKRNT